jgi:alpha,alpha-trehalose-phosphate synthase [UDP-forming]
VCSLTGGGDHGGAVTARGADPSGRGGDHDFVVVANRLPVAVVELPDGPPGWRRSPGGLVSALEPVMQRTDGAWVGWSGTAGAAPDPWDIAGIHLIGVPLSADQVEQFYEGFCNATLWPLYHDVIAPPVFDDHWWDAYLRVNETFATVVDGCAARRATVWVHDYQLQLVPGLLRARRPDLRIGFFNHIPFPGYEIYAQLPWRRQIVQGLLGADLIGFQRRADATNFLRACRRAAAVPTTGGTVRVPAPTPGQRQDNQVGPSEDGAADTHGDGAGRRARVGCFPISIDWAAWADLAGRPDVQARARQIRSDLGNPRIILLGMDRLDYTKGILHRLRAYQSLLDSGLLGPPEAVFVQVASPSRDRVEQYQQLLQDVEALVGRINGEHATLAQPAVRYLHHPYPREEIAALYLAADLMLVTSLRDGMNLVAKEYVCCRPHEDGALVLSEFTGAADELSSAFLVNPHDIHGLKTAILRATQQSPPQARRRMRSLRKQVHDHDVTHWADAFLTALAGTDP